MKFGASTWLWQSPFGDKSIDLIHRIKKFGFDYVEIPVEDTSLVNVKEVNKALKETGLGVTICGAFGPGRDLAHENKSVVDETLKYIEACGAICEGVGSPVFIGPVYSEVGRHPAANPKEREIQLNRSIENMRKAADILDDKGVTLAIEPLNRFETDLVNTVEELKEVLEAIHHQNAKICLDGFHMHIEEANLQRAFETAGEDLVHVQVSESHRGVPGTGSADWEGILQGLANIDYTGGVTIESFTPDNQSLAKAVCIWKPKAASQDEFAKEGLKFLKQLFTKSLVGAEPHPG